MKSFRFLILATITMFACQRPTQPAEPQDDPVEAVYQKNLAAVKAAVSAFENENLDEFGTYVADNAVYYSGAYGSKKGTKEDWKKLLGFFTTDFDSIRLDHPLYLPGIDSVTHKLDGNVRYYGTWVSRHKSGVKTAARFYAVYEFDANNKIVYAEDYFDVGGLLNAVAPKK
jgi:hypothetical protein